MLLVFLFCLFCFFFFFEATNNKNNPNFSRRMSEELKSAHTQKKRYKLLMGLFKVHVSAEKVAYHMATESCIHFFLSFFWLKIMLCLFQLHGSPGWHLLLLLRLVLHGGVLRGGEDGPLSRGPGHHRRRSSRLRHRHLHHHRPRQRLVEVPRGTHVYSRLHLPARPLCS